MIKITINNWTAKITGDKSVLELLYEELSFKHPDAYFIQQKISRAWDGFVRPMSSSGVIPVGILSQVEGFLSEMEVEVEVTDYRVIPEIEEVPKTIGINAPVNLRDYQVEALKNIAYNKVMGILHPRGIIAAGVGAGKTLMMFGVYGMYNKPQTLILVNNSALFNQIKGDLSAIFPDEYGYLRGKDYKEGKIMVAMTQTAIKRPEMAEFFKSVRIILVDEADDQVNTSLKKVIKLCPYAPIRLGFTGTSFVRDLKKDRLRNHELRALFGDELYTINTEELSEKGFTTSTIVKVIKGTHIDSANSYMEEVVKLTSSLETKQLILRRIKYNLRMGRKYIMVYNRYISVAEEIYEFLKENLPDISMGLLDHKRYKSDPSILEDFKTGKIQILVNTLFLKRGINLPKVRVIINNACGDYPSTALQVLGRGVRLDKDKDIFYFEDLFHTGNYIDSHNKSRLRAYKKYGYTIIDYRD